MLSDEEMFDGRVIDLQNVHKVHSIELVRRDIDVLEMIIRYQTCGIKTRMTLVCDLSELD